MRKVLFRLSLITLVSGMLGGSLGYFTRLDLPRVQQLEEYRPPEMTRVLGRGGVEVATFAAEKRILLEYGEVPDPFRRALIASEDNEFLRHTGVDAWGVLRVIWASARQRRPAGGASTLTMQLAGMLFLDRSERTLRRKIQEVFLAMEIERQYSKDEILRLYANHVPMGHGLSGLEAAARFYFGKTARDLDIGECAALVSLLPRPADYSPIMNPELATRRRNLVLRRMVEESSLDAEEAERFAAAPIELAEQDRDAVPTSYFVEEIRRGLRGSYGNSRVYGGGLGVRTTLDPRLQEIGQRVLEQGLRQLDKRQGWRPDAVRKLPGEDPKTWKSPTWSGGSVVGQVTDGVVVAVDRNQATVRVADATGSLSSSEVKWTRRSRVDKLFRVGDVIRVRVEEQLSEGRVRLQLEQEPEVQAALVALDPATGEVLVMVGGFDFSRSEFNRVTQARRQAGSAFKPIVYAAALERGASLTDTMLDEPTVFLDRRGRNPYQPENFSRKYSGRITLRTALEKSANIPSVKLLSKIGSGAAIDMARRLGIESRLEPYPSLALGAFELSLLELTSAYGAFANQGLRVEPHWIVEVTDAQDRPIYSARPEVHDAVDPQVAYLMTSALSGVIRNGTGRAAASLPHALAGKTGTTDNNTDAWFIGYAPRLAVGVWVGFDEPRSLGAGETGARAALPIWTAFMERALADGPDEEFARPAGISAWPIDGPSGTAAGTGPLCDEPRLEFFREGTEPVRSCSRTVCDFLKLPYPFQRYELRNDGTLEIPGNELDELLRSEPQAHVNVLQTTIEFDLPGGMVRMNLHVMPDHPAEDIGWIDNDLDPAWFGTDGRRATIHRFTNRAEQTSRPSSPRPVR